MLVLLRHGGFKTLVKGFFYGFVPVSFKGKLTMERLTLLRDFWTKVRSLQVFIAKFWVTDVKLVVELEKKIIFAIRPSNG
jgi:hypothetical protein